MGRFHSRNKIEFGDFQTPAWLAREVCAALRTVGVMPKSLLEPTCGTGNFLRTGLETFDTVTHVLGMDIQAEHIAYAQRQLRVDPDIVSIDVRQGDFFSTDWRTHLRALPDPLLILGNPPWVTNTELSTLNSTNLPHKENIHGQSGIDAMTGASNFDISEWMLLQMVGWLHERPGILAMLCKTKVARKVLQYLWEQRRSAHCQLWRIDAKKAFGASVDACLFMLNTSVYQEKQHCAFYETIHAQRPSTVIGYRDGQFVANVDLYKHWCHLLADEQKQPYYEWRSGIKHDCTKVMELRNIGGEKYINKLGEVWELEADYLFPMYKSSEIVRTPLSKPQRWMLVTQKTVGESTELIQRQAAKTWRYLHHYSRMFESRRSSIYRNRPPFSIFGVGDYSFSDWKVAISGMYKQLQFVVVGPYQEKPVVFDDTCYFISCHAEEEARFVASLLNSEPAQQFYRSFLFWDDKRPITARLLRTLDLSTLAQQIPTRSGL